MDVLAIITARGGSKGLHRKNVLPLGGKPLMAWTISAALQSTAISRTIVSTDDEELTEVAKSWGAEVPFMRPAELAMDDSGHVAVVEHAIHWLERHEKVCPEYVMLLQPTSPLRTAEDINSAVQLAKEHQAVAVVSVTRTKHHPHLSKQVLGDGTLVGFLPGDTTDLRRQALSPAYALNGAIYLISRESFLYHRTFFPPETFAYIMPAERSIDIDSSWDFHLAELILENAYESKAT